MGEKTLFKYFSAKSVASVKIGNHFLFNSCVTHECHFNGYHCNLEGYESHQDTIMFPRWLLRIGKIIVAHSKPTIIGSHPATFKIFPSLFEESGNILFPEVQCSLSIGSYNNLWYCKILT